MSKSKVLTHFQIEAVIHDYLTALARAKGQQVADRTEVVYRKGHFYIRPPGCSPDFPPLARKPAEIRAMTEKLAGGKQ